MKHADAVELIRPAINGGTRWADLGAGTGTFTRALAELLDDAATIIAVDRDADVLSVLRDRSRNQHAGPAIRLAVGDLGDLAACEALTEAPLDGVLVANALHYLSDPVPTLIALLELSRPGARVVIIEYESRRANPWVPYPLPANRLAGAVRRAGLVGLEVVSTRPSAYRSEMYCAVSTVPERARQG